MGFFLSPTRTISLTATSIGGRHTAISGWVHLSVLALLFVGTPTVSASSSYSARFRREAHKELKKEEEEKCPCGSGSILPRPDLMDKELVARWMVRTLDWGTLTTISSRLAGPGAIPFGNVYSFVDGGCGNSTGTPYFYATYMDQSLLDFRHNQAASLTLSEAAVPTVCGAHSVKACSIHSVHAGDPENPVCARLTLTGQLVELKDDDDDSKSEYIQAKAALLERHPQMQYWPDNHDWVVMKLDIADIWLIDYFGGASILDVDDYYQQSLDQLGDNYNE